MTTMYTADHEWINIEDHEAATVGITHHAQDALGDVVFVDLPNVGATFKKGEVAGVVESVKAAADLYMPVTGEIVEVNEALRADPALANTDPLGTRLVLQGPRGRHGRVRAVDGRPRLRRARQERLRRRKKARHADDRPPPARRAGKRHRVRRPPHRHRRGPTNSTCSRSSARPRAVR